MAIVHWGRPLLILLRGVDGGIVCFCFSYQSPFDHAQVSYARNGSINGVSNQNVDREAVDREAVDRR
jgi:hypothetical protein